MKPSYKHQSEICQGNGLGLKITQSHTFDL